ncbi:MAG TPA: ABC transporter substrate-binding protein [Candidatus Limnocylindrales bacterium]|jgi:ABC-type nitrate/sulfonate/bicarbonate transport system substrate-binding protein|nr:ABC transporter substrate-binding protein [Candidatus Limnocylindrales bacterium]
MARVGTLVATALLLAACSTGGTASSAPSAAPATPAASESAAASEAPSESAAAGPGDPEKTTLKIVQGSDPDFTQVALTKAFENLKAKGIDVEYASVADTDTASRAVIAGQADIVVNSLYFGINAVKNGIPLKTFLVDAQTLDYLLVSRPDVTDVKQLIGGTVGINKPGDLGGTTAIQCLKAQGINVDEVEFVQVGGTSARMAALLAGQIMAAPAHAAEALNAKNEGGLNVLSDCGKEIGSFLQTGATSTEEWLAANPNLAQHFVDAYLDALRWAQTDKAGYIALSKEVVPDLDDSLRDPSYDVLHDAGLFAVNGGLNPESIQKLIDIGIDSKAIEEPVPDTWYTMDFIESYLARNGEQ